MQIRCFPWLAAALLSCGAVRAAEVTIYRCTDAEGRLTLRDTPCRPGERQQARDMLRPKDPARPPADARRPPAQPAAAPAMRVVVVTPPRPLYECITPDGEVYTSETASGDRRWEPYWTIGYPLQVGPRLRHHRGYPWVAPPRTVDGRAAGLVFDNVGRPTPRPGVDRPGVPYGVRLPAVGYAIGAWINDECHPLPAQEVCARLVDRRDELDRRYNSALQSERARITEEQRGIDARLANDCGAY